MAESKHTPKSEWAAEGSLVDSLRTRIKELEGELVTLITFSADLQQRLEAENEQVKGLVAGNLKQIGELKHYLHERGCVIASLEAEKAELVEALQKSKNEIENAIIGLRTDPLAYVEAIKQRLEQVLTEVSAAIAKTETTNPKPEVK